MRPEKSEADVMEGAGEIRVTTNRVAVKCNEYDVAECVRDNDRLSLTTK